MELTYQQKQTLYDQGFIKLPGIVPKGIVHDALWAINASLGSQGINPAQLPTFRLSATAFSFVSYTKITPPGSGIV